MKPARFLIPFVLLAALVTAGWLVGPDLAGRVAFAVEKGQAQAAREELIALSKHDQLSTLFRAVAKAVKPAVVEVRTTKRIKLRRPQVPGLEEFFRRRFGDDFEFEVPGPPPGEAPGEAPRKERTFPSRGLGSGVIVDAAKGYILTNHHVVRGADEVEIVLGDKRKFKAEWIRADWQTDLAIVKIKPDRLIGAPLGDSDKIQVGDWVLAIGAPEGLPQTVTAGILSARGRTTNSPGMRYESFLQTDAAINRGNSGGPLVNMRGEIIGINARIVSRSFGNEGIGLAIPSNMARDVMKQLIDTGKVVRGYLGVGIQDVTGPLAKSLNLPDTKGSLVRQVLDDTPAAAGGLKVGDFIIAVNGRAVAGSNDLRNLIAAIAPGRKAKIKVIRDGKAKTLPVKIGEQPKAWARGPGGKGDPAAAPKAVKNFGLDVATFNEELAKKYKYKDAKSIAGVVITDVEDASDAAEQGLRKGMVILQVQGKAVKTAEGFAKAVSAKEAAAGIRLLVVDPRGAQRFVFITPKK